MSPTRSARYQDQKETGGSAAPENRRRQRPSAEHTGAHPGPERISRRQIFLDPPLLKEVISGKEIRLLAPAFIEAPCAPADPSEVEAERGESGGKQGTRDGLHDGVPAYPHP